MFTAHFAVALAGAGSGRRLPLWLLIIAAFGGDLTEAGVALLRISDATRVWSHSIPATVLLGLLLGLLWRAAGGAWRECGILVAVAASHSLLDFVTATKQFVPGVAPFGLNLYEYPYADGVLEGAIGVVGWAIWRSSLPANRRSAAVTYWMLATLLVAQTIVAVSVILWEATLATQGLSKFVH